MKVSTMNAEQKAKWERKLKRRNGKLEMAESVEEHILDAFDSLSMLQEATKNPGQKAVIKVAIRILEDADSMVDIIREHI